MDAALDNPKINPAAVPRSAAGPTYFRAIQILRGLAAVSVVLYHMSIYTASIGGDKNTFFRHFGPLFSHIGIFFFFVVSGFLMAYLIDSGTSLFLPRRLLRIYPTYWLAAILVIAFDIIFMESPFHPRVFGLVTLLPIDNAAHSQWYPLGVEWTLVYEIFFYFVCAVFANRHLRRALPVFLLLWLAVIGVASVVSRSHAFTYPNFAMIWFSPFDVPFISGAIGFYVYKTLPPLKWPLMISCVVLAVPLITIAEYGLNRRGVGYWAAKYKMNPLFPSLLIYALAILLILVSWLAAEKNHPKSVRRSILERFGDCSYALYLIHVPVITGIYLETIHFKGDRTALAILTFLSTLTAGILLGQIDILIHSGFKKLLGKRKTLKFVPSSVAALVPS